MISNKRKSALARYFTSLFKMNLPKVGVSFHWLPVGSKELGYTYRKKNHASIHLNLNSEGPLEKYYAGLTDDQQVMFVTGVAVHEIMHQLLTNFVLTEKMIKKLSTPKEQKLFKILSNILEDARIESFAPSYFGGPALAALNYCIKQIWVMSDDIKPEDSIIEQVMNAMIQYGDLGDVKPEMSAEAQEVFDKIIIPYNEAIDSTSCAVCLVKAKECMEILLPYVEKEEDIPEDGDSSSTGDSTGEDAEESDESSKSRKKKYKHSRTSASSTESSSSKSGDKAEDSDDDKSDEETGTSSGTGEETDIGADGVGDGESESFGDGDIDEVYDDDEASEEDFEESSRALEETLKSLEASEEAATESEKSDYDFGSVEHPSGDKWVKTIAHHKATPNPSDYERYRDIVASDAHELAKLIKRQFKTKPGGRKRSDHGDLNLMRYKDPNFRSPLIFDKKKPHEKHSAAVMLLVDESGSMGGSRIHNARLAAAMLAEALYEAGIPCCVVGHSGDDRYKYSVELEHYTTFKNAPADRASIPMIAARCQNRDGPAIRWASSILKKRPERNKLMIIISDGQPCADSYYGDDAIFDTKSAIREAKRLFSICGVILEAGYSADVLRTMYGSDYVECENASQLKRCIEQIIQSQCKNW